MGRSARSLRNSTRLLTLPGQNGFWTCPSGESRRFRQLEPVIRRTFDIPTMVRLSVGPSRANLTEARPRGHGKEGQRRFVHDSPLEGEGFEPSVPRRGQHFSRLPRSSFSETAGWFRRCRDSRTRRSDAGLPIKDGLWDRGRRSFDDGSRNCDKRALFY